MSIASFNITPENTCYTSSLAGALTPLAKSTRMVQDEIKEANDSNAK
jgi:hypothetical protein